MTSIINSENIKKIVLRAVEKALIECASQHELNGLPYNGVDGNIYEPSEDMLKFSNNQPTKLKIKLEFLWDSQQPLPEGRGLHLTDLTC